MATWNDGQQPETTRSAWRSQRGQQQEAGSLADANFLTIGEVALIMRVSKMTVYRLVHSGELVSIRVGRSFRVPEPAVHDYLKASFVVGTAP